jgi:hypothetical protein
LVGAQITLRQGDAACAARAVPPLAQALRTTKGIGSLFAQQQGMLIHGVWCGQRGRTAGNARVFATLIANPEFGASLREEIEHRGDVAVGAVAVEFTLLVERALAELQGTAP